MITLQPIGIVRNSRQFVEDDNWGGILSVIQEQVPPADVEAAHVAETHTNG